MFSFMFCYCLSSTFSLLLLTWHQFGYTCFGFIYLFFWNSWPNGRIFFSEWVFDDFLPKHSRFYQDARDDFHLVAAVAQPHQEIQILNEEASVHLIKNYICHKWSHDAQRSKLSLRKRPGVHVLQTNVTHWLHNTHCTSRVFCENLHDMTKNSYNSVPSWHKIILVLLLLLFNY